ncbi:MAG: ABC transporter permease subunit [Lachnospiraceae bacterium]|nr:ABC transporter permease subunit [Lachnospiraceae bacterium]
MNIIKKELRIGIKPFAFWVLGLFFLDFVGMIKFSGIEASAGSVNVTELMNQFPRVVLAVFGIAGLDISTLGGYYAVLAFYALICVSIYAIHLGTSAINRESIDKTYEFIFTKPRKRQYIIGIKLLANSMYLILFCIVHVIFSLLAVLALKIEGNINEAMVLFGVSAFLVGMVFFSMGSFFAAIVRRGEKGVLFSNLCFLTVFIIGVIYDMLEHGRMLRFLTPLKYFLPQDLLNNDLNIGFMCLCVVIILGLLYGTVRTFYKKDLTAMN